MQGHGAGHGGEGGGFYDDKLKKYIYGAAYDNYKQPRLPGSGGDETHGGGAIKLQVSGEANIEGEIRAE